MSEWVRSPGQRVRVTVEVPRWSFVKRKGDGRVDFVSPLPTIFNYGAVEGVMAPDGDALDALVLGPRLPLGTRLEVRAWGHVDFIDAGAEDPKLVCTLASPPSRAQWCQVRAFFVLYARLKGLLNRARAQRGATRLRAISIAL